MEAKRCTKCDETKTVDAFGKNRTKCDGLGSWCKECENARAKASYAKNRHQQIARVRAYHAEHCDKHRAYSKSYHAKHREEISARKAVSRVAYYAEHREQVLARVKAWCKANPERVKANRHRRRARKLSASGSFDAKDISRQGKTQKWKCWWCGRPCKDTYHIDHLVPLAKGGHNNITNIVISCPHCNLSKHDKLPSEFAGKLF